MSRGPKHTFALVALFVLAGCDEESHSDVACVFGDEHRVAAARGGFSTVRVAELGDGFAAIWSSHEGAFVRAIDGEGTPTGAPVRIGAGCDAGMDAATTATGLAVACLIAAVPAQDKPGLVSLVTIDDSGHILSRRTVGEVGEGSRGISLVSKDGHLALAYFDGERRAVFFADADEGPKPEPRMLSREGPTAGPPRLFVDGDRLLATWAETVTDPMNDTLVGEVLISDLESEPARFANVLYDDAQPVLTRDAEGLVVGFRDENPAGSRVGLFTARVGDDLEKDGELWRVGRSDAASGVALFPCAGGLYAVAPHTYSRREMLVGVSRLDSHLDSIAGERQIYTSGARYEHGTGTCSDGAALLLVAQRAQTPSGEAVLKSMTLRCDR